MTDRIPLAQHTKASLDQLYGDLDRARILADPELHARLTAAINALGKSETELAALRAGVTRIRALVGRWVKAGPPVGVPVARWWDVRLAELHAAIHAPTAASCSPTAAETEPNNAAATQAAEPHIYLSTGCYHKDHAYCQNMTGLAGAKRPASCKFCHAACQCPCHQQAEPPVHIGGRANAEDCPACTGTNPDYPFICPGPDAEQPARTTAKNPAGA